jgi:hypothetical protein
MRKACTALAMIAVGTLVLAAPPLAGGRQPVTGVVLGKFRFAGSSWEMAAVRDRGGPSNTACLVLGEGVEGSYGSKRAYSFVPEAAECGLPAFVERGFRGTDRKPRILRVFAFPREVTRIELSLGNLGRKQIGLHFLTRTQAAKGRVPRLSWGFSRVIGYGCFEAITAFNARGGRVFEARDSSATPCEPRGSWLEH